MTFRQVIDILEKNGIQFKRQGKGSHRLYEGTIGGEKRVVVVAYSNLGDEVKPGTLSAIIRRSGIPKNHFRN